MKKSFIVVCLLVGCVAFSQKGNVGINTQNPTETLNVNGTLRVNELPMANDKINTTPQGTISSIKNQDFLPTKMVVVDNNGVVGKADIPSSGYFYQGSSSIALEGNSFQREALMGDAVADKNSNQITVVAIQNNPISNEVPTDGQVLQWDGIQWAPATLNIPEISEDSDLGNGTVIAINGRLQIAEEITATMSNDIAEIKNSNNSPKEIPFITEVIVNNKKLFKSSHLGNSFQVSQDGVYQIIMNVQYSYIPNPDPNVNDGFPVFGIWSNNLNKWIARIYNQYDILKDNQGYRKQTATLITTANLKTGETYSFRVAHASTVTVFGYSSGSTGAGPVTFVSVKQLK